MAGLNYGNTFLLAKKLPEGIFFDKRIKKWLVRIKSEKININGIKWVGVISIGAFSKKEDAEECYKIAGVCEYTKENKRASI